MKDTSNFSYIPNLQMNASSLEHEQSASFSAVIYTQASNSVPKKLAGLEFGSRNSCLTPARFKRYAFICTLPLLFCHLQSYWFLRLKFGNDLKLNLCVDFKTIITHNNTSLGHGKKNQQQYSTLRQLQIKGKNKWLESGHYDQIYMYTHTYIHTYLYLLQAHTRAHTQYVLLKKAKSVPCSRLF